MDKPLQAIEIRPSEVVRIRIARELVLHYPLSIINYQLLSDHLDADGVIVVVIFEAAIIKGWSFDLRLEVIREAIGIGRDAKYVCGYLTITVEVLEGGDSICTVRDAGELLSESSASRYEPKHF